MRNIRETLSFDDLLHREIGMPARCSALLPPLPVLNPNEFPRNKKVASNGKTLDSLTGLKALWRPVHFFVTEGHMKVPSI